MAEEFAFEQTLVQGAAIDADVGTIGPQAESMDGAGNEFLAGAGFADEQDIGHGGSGEARGAPDAAHGGAIADHVGQ